VTVGSPSLAEGGEDANSARKSTEELECTEVIVAFCHCVSEKKRNKTKVFFFHLCPEVDPDVFLCNLLDGSSRRRRRRLADRMRRRRRHCSHGDHNDKKRREKRKYCFYCCCHLEHHAGTRCGHSFRQPFGRFAICSRLERRRQIHAGGAKLHAHAVQELRVEGIRK
jgi:hypothetical protein